MFENTRCCCCLEFILHKTFQRALRAWVMGRKGLEVFGLKKPFINQSSRFCIENFSGALVNSIYMSKDRVRMVRTTYKCVLYHQQHDNSNSFNPFPQNTRPLSAKHLIPWNYKYVVCRKRAFVTNSCSGGIIAKFILHTTKEFCIRRSFRIYSAIFQLYSAFTIEEFLYSNRLKYV